VLGVFSLWQIKKAMSSLAEDREPLASRSDWKRVFNPL